MPTRPPRLHFGDTVGILAPASPPPDPTVIDRCVTALEKLGFKPRLASNVRRRNGFLAGTDRERASDVMKLFVDNRIKAIFCLRGGYGSARILPLLDYQKIRAHPKILVGYSDITSLHCALLTRANLISFHGPTLSFHFGQPATSSATKKEAERGLEFTTQTLLRTLMIPEPAGRILGDSSDFTRLRHCTSGQATGQLVGGNLSVLCTTIGTPYQPSFREKILFLEDVGEAPYRMDRMLTHLLNAGLLQQVAGIAIGINNKCVDENAASSGEFRQSVDDVLEERLSPLKVPVLIGLPFGHVRHNATLPVGARALLDADKGDLRILQSAVL